MSAVPDEVESAMSDPRGEIAPTPKHQERLEWHRADRWGRRKAIEEEGVEEEDANAWAPQSLEDTDPLPPPTIMEIGGIEGGGTALVRQGDVVNVHGVSTAGKSPLVYLVLAQQVRKGSLALIVDYEMGHQRAKALLLELGLTPDEIREGIYYVPSPPLLSSVSRRRLIDLVARRGEATGRLLTVGATDSLTKSMTRTPGVDDNRAMDVTNWYTDLPHWLRDQFGITEFVIDHSSLTDGPRPSGSHKKKEEADHHFWLRLDSAFSRLHENGRASLRPVKDRSGETEVDSTVAMLRTRFGGSFYLDEPGVAHADDEDPGSLNLDLTGVSEFGTCASVLKDLEQRGPTMKTDFCGKGGASDHRRKALDWGRSKGLADWVQAGRGNTGQMWSVTDKWRTRGSGTD